MKVTTRKYMVTERTYECEGCGHQSDVEITTAHCPLHGEYCSNCCNREESKFPLMICPKCDIKWLDVMRRAEIVGPNLAIGNINLAAPIVLLRNDTTGWWLGREKEDG